MIKKRTIEDGPVLQKGPERLEAPIQADNTYTLLHVAEDGTSSIVVTEIKDAFEVLEAVAWYADKAGIDGDELLELGRKAQRERAESFTAATVEEVEATGAVQGE